MPDAKAPGSLWLDVSPTVRRRLAPGSSIVAVGAVASTSQDQVAGVGSALAAASTARTSNVWFPSASAAVVCGVVQIDQLPPSTRHSNVAPASFESKVKVGVGLFDGVPGFESRFVSGTVRSTVTPITTVAWREALSVAVA